MSDEQDWLDGPEWNTRNVDSVAGCWCYQCATRKERMTRMIVCPTCGNKRCPHGTNHRLGCSGSNDPGQQGSRYE